VRKKLSSDTTALSPSEPRLRAFSVGFVHKLVLVATKHKASHTKLVLLVLMDVGVSTDTIMIFRYTEENPAQCGFPESRTRASLRYCQCLIGLRMRDGTLTSKYEDDCDT